MQKLFFYVDKLSEQSGKLFAWIIVILTLSIVYEVAARYLFNAPTIRAWDLSYMLYGAHFMMGAAYTLHLKANVRIDVFYRYLSPKRQALVDLCMYPVFFFPALIVLFVVGVQHFVYAWEIGERTSMTMWRVSLVPFKAVLPVASLLLILQGIYDIPLATGTILAGGTLGILIPPSVMLILYGPMAGLSIARLFAAAVMPGLLLASLYIAYIAVRCYLKPELGPALSKEQRTMTSAQLLTKLSISLAPPLALILAVLGSIFFGLAAPTEAAAMGGFGAAILCAAYGKFNWPNLVEVSHIYRGVIPFVILQIIGLTLCILFPQIITWLPKDIYG